MFQDERTVRYSKYIILTGSVLLVVIAGTIWKWNDNERNFYEASDAIAPGQSQEQVQRILVKHNIHYDVSDATSVTSGGVTAVTKIGLFGSDLVLNMVFDNNHKVVYKEGFDTGFHMGWVF
jgi:hypothetical protein